MNEFIEYLLILTIINIIISKIFQHNEYLHSFFMLNYILTTLLAFEQCDGMYLLMIVGLLCFNVILSIFVIISAVMEKRVKNNV